MSGVHMLHLSRQHTTSNWQHLGSTHWDTPETHTQLTLTCTRAPSMPFGFRSTRIRWLSVPPDTTLYPSSTIRLDSAWQLSTTCFWYSLKSGELAERRATASAEMVWLWGPPCKPCGRKPQHSDTQFRHRIHSNWQASETHSLTSCKLLLVVHESTTRVNYMSCEPCIAFENNQQQHVCLSVCVRVRTLTGNTALSMASLNCLL